MAKTAKAKVLRPARPAAPLGLAANKVLPDMLSAAKPVRRPQIATNISPYVASWLIQEPRPNATLLTKLSPVTSSS